MGTTDGIRDGLRLVGLEPSHPAILAGWFAADPPGAARLSGFYAAPDGWVSAVENDERRMGWLVLREGSPVGFLDLDVDEDGRTAHLAFYVAPEWRGRGVCKAMLRCLIGLAAVEALHAVRAGVEPDNTASVACLEKAGFVREGRDEDGLLRYAKPLREAEPRNGR